MGLATDDLLRAPWLRSLDSRLFAVGVPCGSCISSGGRSPQMNIRLGGRMQQISRSGFAAWWQLLRPRMPQEITEWIESERLGRGGEVLADLHARGVLVGFTGDAIADMPSLGAMRLVPVGLGMGSTPDAPDRCTVQFGFVGAAVTLTPVSYTVWSASDGRTPLGEACRIGATELGLQVDEVWSQFHQELPALTAGGMALLDR